jgi:hypothetical protein
MGISSRIQPIDRDIELLIDQTATPKAQSQFFAKFAGEQIEEAKQINRKALGRVPRYTVSVDGRLGAPLNSVRPDGTVFVEFELIDEVLSFIATALQKASPVLSGRYAKSHALFADGTEINWNQPVPFAETYTFINEQPYARKIERGQSSQAPTGVYQAVATLARSRFGNQAKISFAFQSLQGGAISGWAGSTRLGSQIRNPRRRAEWLTRQPAIIVRTT